MMRSRLTVGEENGSILRWNVRSKSILRVRG